MDVIIGVYYRPPRQDNDSSELSFEELRDTFKTTALVLTGTSTCQMLIGSTTEVAQIGPE